MNCWKCKEVADLYCPHEVGVFSCKNHIGEHLIEESKEGHHPKSCFPIINREARSTIVSYLRNWITKLEGEKQNTLKEFREKYDKIFADLSQKLEPIQKSSWEISNLAKKLIEIKVFSELNTKEVEKLESLVPKNVLNHLFDVEPMVKELQSSFDSLKIPEIVAINRESKRLIKANLNALTISRSQMSETCDSLISMCKIPGDGVFCYGDWPPSGLTFIITNDNSIIHLEPGRPCCNTKSLNHDGFIYAFGGFKNKSVKSDFASRFCLQTQRWKALAPMPKPSSGVFSLLYDGEILLLGSDHDKLYSYNIQSNSYREVADMVKDMRRVMFGFNKSVYIIECEGRIMKSEKNLNEWNVIGAAGAFRPPISYVEFYNESFYFMDFSCYLYQFKLSEKQLSIVELHEELNTI